MTNRKQITIEMDLGPNVGQPEGKPIRSIVRGDPLFAQYVDAAFRNFEFKEKLLSDEPFPVYSDDFEITQVDVSPHGVQFSVKRRGNAK